MKKILLIGILLFNFCSISAQKINWKQIDSKEDEFNLTSTYYLLNDNTFCAVYATPPTKTSEKTSENYVLRTFNNDFSKFSQVGIPPETPNSFIIKPFKNYTIVYGCDVEPWKSNPRLEHYLKSRVIFADKQMNPLVNIELKQYNEKFILEGTPDLYFNYDSSCVILANIEKPFSNSQSMPFGGGYEKKQYGITVINGSMEKVWSGIIDFEDIFGKGVQVDNFRFEYLNNHFFLIASVKGAPTKKMESSINMVEFDDKGTSNIIHKEVFKMEALKWDSFIDKNQVMTVGGYYTTNYKNLFSFQYSFKSKSLTKPIKTVVVDKDFTKDDEEVRAIFKPDFVYPFTLIPMVDGFIWYREDGAFINNNFYIEDINLIKFDGNLKLQWIKRIHKDYRRGMINSDHGYSSYFVRGNNLILFYYDYEKDIKNGYKISVKSDGGSDLCLAMATVSPNGEITKEIVYDVIESQILGNTYKMYSIVPGKYIIEGEPNSTKETDNSYIGTIDLTGK